MKPCYIAPLDVIVEPWYSLDPSSGSLLIGLLAGILIAAAAVVTGILLSRFFKKK